MFTFDKQIKAMKLSDLDFSKTYTYADYLTWTFEERLEIIKGKLFRMSPAPNRLHQEVSGNIYAMLWTFLKNKPCSVYSAPFDVRLFRKSKNDEEVLTVLQPDICVVCDPEKLDEKGCIGAPDIVVEILSPGNNKKELKHKYEVYEEAQVQEYWVVHPLERTFLKYTLLEGKYQPSRLMVSGEEVSTPVLPGFILKLEELFGEA